MYKAYMIDYEPATAEWIIHERDLDDPDKPPLNHGMYCSEEEAKRRLDELLAGSARAGEPPRVC